MIKTTIKFNDEDFSASESPSKQVEYLPEFIRANSLEKKFKVIINHSANVPYEPMGLYVYCDMGVDKNMDNSISQRVKMPLTGYVCFDTMTKLEELVIEKAEKKSILFTTKENISLALFIIPDRSMICCDLTHNQISSEMLKYILNWLIQKGYLPDLPEPEEEKKVEKPLMFKFSFGADPEYEVVKNGRPFDLNLVQEDDFEFPLSSSSSHEIGVDGAGSQLEIRPKPGKDENSLVSNIGKLMKEIENAGVHISTVGERFPLGGHIHIGIKCVGNRKKILNFNGTKKLVKLLDYYFGELARNANGDARIDYGALGDYRMEKRKGVECLEYRTPPAAIFLSPKICKLAIRICRLICIKAINGREKFILGDKSLLRRLVQLGLTKTEACMFFRFSKKVTKAFTYVEDITKIWSDGKEEERVLKLKRNKNLVDKILCIGFKDTWAQEVKNIFEYTLSSIKTKKLSINLMLYGLKESRGDAFAGVMLGNGWGIATGLTSPVVQTSEKSFTINIGVPHSVRTGKKPMDVALLHAALNSLVGSILAGGYRCLEEEH